MSINASNSKLQQIDVELVQPNPENPRILFRQGEMDDLLESIRTYGVQVPISVYRKGTKFFLIDGERRWRCSLKLNAEKIPALIQEEPAQLTNLLLMFNIHALREQWDLLTIAMKLPTVIDLLKIELGHSPNEGELSKQTGLNRGLLRRCALLIALPAKYKSMILKELEKPKSQQKLTEDFFIEMERSLKTVSRSMPGAISDLNQARHALIKKYRSGVINSMIDLRKIPKIAKAERVGADSSKAQEALTRLFEDNDYSIEQAFGETVSEYYSERDLISRISSILDRLNQFDSSSLDDALRERLHLLVNRASELLTQ
jgi:ParB family transcriptional regulator, chromosome partitioning protein